MAPRHLPRIAATFVEHEYGDEVAPTIAVIDAIAVLVGIEIMDVDSELGIILYERVIQ